MAHEITINADGFAEIALADRPAWHGLGTVLRGAPDSATMIRAARLDWTVEQRALQTVDGIDVPTHFANVRSDNGKLLGVVGQSYRMIQNRDAFAFLDSLVEAGGLRFESAGSLREGRTVWALARMPSYDEIAPGDASLRYVLFSTSHDGSSAVYAIPTSTRVVCANTLRVATGAAVGIRHTGDVDTKLETARRLLSQYDEKFTLFRDHARRLASLQVKRSEAEAYLNTLFPEPDRSQPRTHARWVRELRTVFRNLQNERQTIRSINGTWWALVNAVTETVDHGREASSRLSARESRFWSRVDGAEADRKADAFALALDMSA